MKMLDASILRYLARLIRNRRHSMATLLMHIGSRKRGKHRPGRPRTVDPRATPQAIDGSTIEYLARLSHDLRSPANTILGYIGNLEDGVRGGMTPEQLEDLARMRRVANRLISLVEQQLQYATIQGGVLRLAPADIPLSQAVTELQEAVGPQLRAREIAFDRSTCRAGACQAVVRADPVALMRILTNLLDNAIKFTPAGGRITVSCCADAETGRATVRVCDTGPGIPASEIENIFQPYVQLETPVQRAHGGVGLGLANSRDLARAMGGELRAESMTGAGAVFVLTLPLA